MDLEKLLSQRINMPQIRSVVSWVSGSQRNLSQLWRLAGSDDRLTSVNALWVMTHLPAADSEWLQSLRDSLTDMLLGESDTSKKRMLLQLLKHRKYEPEDVRTDLLDYCMSKINSECEPYAIKAFCIYTAYKLCRHYPELMAELEQHLDMMQYQTLSPGLKSAFRKTKSDIAKLTDCTPHPKPID